MAKPSKIQKLSEAPEFVRMMVVGSPGFGKTVFAGTAPKAIFLTTDPEGTVSARRAGSTADEWPIESWAELNDAYRYLRDEGFKEYDWVILDNITEAQRLAMKESMENARKQNASRDEYVPAQQDYQRTQNALIAMVLKFNDLPMNIIYTAHRTTTEDANGDAFYSAAIHGQQGSLAQQVLGYTNINGFGEVVTVDGKEIRRMYFTHAGSQRGKDRYEALGRYKDNLTVPKMMALIESALDGGPVTSAPAVAKKTAPRRPVRAPIQKGSA